MTKEIEIREAVEILNNNTIRIQILSDFADKEYCGQALQVLLNLAQQYLKAKMLEEYKDIEKSEANQEIKEYMRGYNCGLSDSRLWQEKCLLSLEQVISDAVNQGLMDDKDTAMIIKDQVIAIHNLINRKKE